MNHAQKKHTNLTIWAESLWSIEDKLTVQRMQKRVRSYNRIMREK